MQSSKKSLTPKESMIMHSIELRVSTLYSHFEKNTSEPHEALANFINKAIATPLQASEAIDDISHLMGISKPNFISRVSKELRGIFNPNFKVLNRIYIINSPRDPEKISEDDFPNIAPSLQSFSYKALETSFSMHPKLREYSHLLSIPKMSSNENEKIKEHEESKEQININNSPK